MSLKNFLPLRREVREHWIYQDSDYFKTWVEMLFAARFSKTPKKDIYEGSLYTIKYGEFLFSRPKWCLRLNIKDHKLKKLIKLLNDEGMITKSGRVGKSGATIYLIKNYDKYNNIDSQTPALSVGTAMVEGNPRQPKDNQAPAKGQPNTSQTPLKKNDKTEKKGNNGYTEEFNSLYKLYPNSKAKSDTFKNYTTRLKQHTHDELEKTVVRYKKEIEHNKNQFPYSSNNFFGKKAYYEDYLDGNYEEQEVKKAPVLIWERDEI